MADTSHERKHPRNIKELWERLKEIYDSMKDILSWHFVFTTIFRIVIPMYLRNFWYGNRVQDRVLDWVKKEAKRGDPCSVLDALGRFHEECEWTIMLESDKRRIFTKIAKDTAPMVTFEMGCFIGCSAIIVGSHLPPGARLITSELSDLSAKVAREIIDYAGLSEVITVVNLPAKSAIGVLRSDYGVDKLDLVLIDHVKWEYLADLKLLEDGGFLKKGSVVAADNTIFPGAPDYLEHVETSGKYKTERHLSMDPTFHLEDAVAVSTYLGEDDQ